MSKERLCAKNDDAIAERADVHASRRMRDNSAGYPIPPLAWCGMSAAPVVSSEGSRWGGPLIRWWRDVEPNFSQPALDHHYLALHLGGPTRVERRGEGSKQAVNIQAGALSIAPAGTAYEWNASSRVEVAHIYLSPPDMRKIAVEEFDRDVRHVNFDDRLGMRDPLLRCLLLEILEETAGTSGASRLYLDTLLRSLQLRLLRNYANAPAAPLKRRYSITPIRLRRVVDFVEASIAKDIGLSDLAAVAGSSPFHFSRAFAGVMGIPPYAYLLSRRIDTAKHLLITGDEPLGVVASQCGFHSTAQFSRMFKRVTGGSAQNFRNRI